MHKYEKTRDSIVAGSFYPHDPYVLKMQIENYLNNATYLDIENIKALISPHAGYIYSGQVAAYSYKQIMNKKYDSIIIISPSHSEYFDFVSVFDGDAYNTPLGRVNIDKKRSKLLVESSPYINFSEYGHNNEHSIEVQLPFLQYIYGEFDFIPMVIGAQNNQNIHNIGKTIGELFGNENILIIASTDLSHYHPYGEAVMLDKQVEKLVENFDIENLQREFLKNNIEMCGGGPVAAAMSAAKALGANKAVILKYLNSGDVTGDRKAVVGYLSAALYEDKNKKESDIKMNQKKDIKNNVVSSCKKNFSSSNNTYVNNKNSSSKSNSDDVTSMKLTKKEKSILLEIAKESIKSAVLGVKSNFPTINDVALNEKCGAFVTITSNGKLRGCIGNIRAINPLWETIKTMAKEAALNDPRFYPLTAKDIENINIEISVLSPFKLINNINEISVGKHGLFIKRGFYQGLLLPQVATDYSWDRIQFLKETCKKAGLYENCWQEKNCEIYIFSATVFSEEDLAHS
ncbi:MAG: AmmeMemoRadiSam system protein B [Actinomycetota bacterium]|nr:AmmeMemoRadiSam system protein B [Actinomycetota bacterium]